MTLRNIAKIGIEGCIAPAFAADVQRERHDEPNDVEKGAEPEKYQTRNIATLDGEHAVDTNDTHGQEKHAHRAEDLTVSGEY